MSLEIEAKKFNPWLIVLIILLFGAAATFLVRVIVYEQNYYSEQVGKERVNLSIDAESMENLDETEITDAQKKEYTVGPTLPRFLSIPALNIFDARILRMGVKNGAIATPNNIYDAGWYNASAKPGQGGTIFIDGHSGGPTQTGIFRHLSDLAVGERIKIERGDGEIFIYEVADKETVLLSDATKYMKTALSSPVSGKESLTLVSCTGEWSQTRGTYLSRIFVRAILVE